MQEMRRLCEKAKSAFEKQIQTNIGIGVDVDVFFLVRAFFRFMLRTPLNFDVFSVLNRTMGDIHEKRTCWVFCCQRLFAKVLYTHDRCIQIRLYK